MEFRILECMLGVFAFSNHFLDVGGIDLTSCPDSSWTMGSSSQKCYKLVQMPLSFNEASKWCLDFGHLAAFEAEDELITQIFNVSGRPRKAWIGSCAKNERFECLAIVRDSRNTEDDSPICTGFQEISDCEQRNPFVCEYKAVLSTDKIGTALMENYNFTLNLFSFIQGDETNCGRIFKESSGFLNYKSGIEFANYERCFWIIRSQAQSCISFRRFLAGNNIAQSKTHSLLVCSFTANEPPLTGCKDLTKEQGTVKLYGQVAVISFVSDGTEIGTGFTLHYSTEQNSTGISQSSRDIIVQGRQGITSNIVHPTSGNYSNYELSTFLFTLPNNNLPKMLKTVWKLRSLEGCLDPIFVYTFSMSSWWSFNARLCARSKIVNFDQREPILFIFKTDSSFVGQGFTINSSVV